MTNATKHAQLIALLDWADSPDGAGYRASLAHSNQPSAVTVQDLLAVLPPYLLAKVRKVAADHDLPC